MTDLTVIEGGGNPLEAAVAAFDGNLAKLLEDTRAYVSRFLVVGDEAKDLIAVWVAHTYVVDCFRATPYLNFTSPEPGSGKTAALEVLAVLTHKGIDVDGISPAALYRLLDSTPTLLLDEVDAVFGPKPTESGEALRQILNSGYRKDKKVYRVANPNSKHLAVYDVYSPKAVAGLRELPGTLAHRSFAIHMKPALSDEPREDFDIDEEEIEATAAGLRARFESWAEVAEEDLRDRRNRPEKLIQLDARRNQISRPLLTIADQAGDDWARRARIAVVRLGGDDNSSPRHGGGAQLLADIRTVYDADRDNPLGRGGDRLSCAEIVEDLNRLDDATYKNWNGGGGITTRELGWKLKPYLIKANSIYRDAEKLGNGYYREQFEDAWKRYCNDPVKTTGETGETQSESQKSPSKEPGAVDSRPVAETAVNPVVDSVLPVSPVLDRGLVKNGRCARHGDEPKDWCQDCQRVAEDAESWGES